MIYVEHDHVVNNVEVLRDGMIVFGGGTAINTYLYEEGYMDLYGSARDTFVKAAASGMFIKDGGRAFYGSIRGKVYVSSGGWANYLTTTAQTGCITVSTGGHAYHTFIEENGIMYLWGRDAEAINTEVVHGPVRRGRQCERRRHLQQGHRERQRRRLDQRR